MVGVCSVWPMAPQSALVRHTIVPLLSIRMNVEDVVCWQVIDAQSGEIVWTLADFVDALRAVQSAFLWPKEGTNAEVIQWDVSNAAISGDGTLLALLVTEGDQGQAFVVNIQDNRNLPNWPVLQQGQT